MRSRCAATYASSSQSNSSVSSQSPACPGAQHTQRHNVVAPLLHNHERRVQRVLAHVLHTLRPHADQAGRHALHLVVLLLHEADPSSLSIHGLLLQEAAERCHMYGRPNVRNNGHSRSITHLRSLHSPTHKKTVSWGKDARRTTHAQGHMQ
ncbi:hypothetical protein TcCL_NonESM07017 [Trypanosoma cruzi]|nr:hypothetical protein TcCL_NonESM07017 [Trypanosoma cruzi]